MRGMLFLGLVALTGVGCANARYYQKDANGGIIAMSSNSEGNREKALKLIVDHVGPGYQIVEEREVVTGQSTTNQADTRKELAPSSEIPFLAAEKKTTVSTTTTRDLTEWQIVYRRGPAMTSPPVQSAGAVQPAGGAAPAVQPAAGLQPPVGTK